jgi:hypothetical protein
MKSLRRHHFATGAWAFEQHVFFVWIEALFTKLGLPYAAEKVSYEAGALEL